MELNIYNKGATMVRQLLNQIVAPIKFFSEGTVFGGESINKQEVFLFFIEDAPNQHQRTLFQYEAQR